MIKTYKKLILILSLPYLLIGLMGCRKETKLQYDNKSDITTLKEQELSTDIEELNLPYEVRTALSVVYKINTLKSDGIVDLVRYNKDKFYSVTLVEDNKYLFLLYEENNEEYHVVDGFLTSTLVDKKIFENISVGMRLEDIIEKDPSSCVFENYSYHRFSDKSMLRIEYVLEDNHDIVSEFYFLENPEGSVLDYLLPEDLEKILQ